MKIGDHDLERDVLLIAEIGANHEGDFDKARELVRLAAEAGAHAVKFQAYYIDDMKFISPKADPGRFERSRRNELSLEQFRTLAQDAAQEDLMFLCTCFDPDTVQELNDVLPAFKVASGDLTNAMLLRAIADTGKPILLSTGMGDDEAIQAALEMIAHGPDLAILEERVVLLQCTSSYPCPPDQTHLRAIPYLRDRYGLRVGYSDHTLGILASQMAVALGACVLEKHFTDQKIGREFRDHQLSGDQEDFRELRGNLHLIREFLGEHGKSIQPCELENLVPMRRSVGVRQPVDVGVPLCLEDLVALRPGSGWPASDPDSLLGRSLNRALEAGELIGPGDLS